MSNLKITDYELTLKGQEAYYKGKGSASYLGKPESLRHIRNLTLESIEAGYFPKDKYLEMVQAIPYLEKRGYVVKKSTSSRLILSEISNPELKEDLDIYSRLANNKSVEDWEVDHLFRKSSEFLKRSMREAEESPEDKPGIFEDGKWKASSKLVKSARTRGDKIVAIDSVMSLQHDRGTIGGLGFWTTLERESEDERLTNRLLTRLFEGD